VVRSELVRREGRLLALSVPWQSATHRGAQLLYCVLQHQGDGLKSVALAARLRRGNHDLVNGE
jgi:hypothetical protein